MGFLSKLFGRGGNETFNEQGYFPKEPEPAPAETERKPLAEDENFTIRPAQGQGYDKQAVTDETNRLMFELMLLDGAFESKQMGEPYMLPPHEQRAVSDEVTIQLSDFWWHQTEGRKPIDTFRKISMRLPEGQSVSWAPEAPEYSAVTLTLDFTGTLEITINGKVYNLTHEVPGKVEVFGTRLYKTNPDIKVRALVHSQVKSLKAELFDCGE